MEATMAKARKKVAVDPVAEMSQLEKATEVMAGDGLDIPEFLKRNGEVKSEVKGGGVTAAPPVETKRNFNVPKGMTSEEYEKVMATLASAPGTGGKEKPVRAARVVREKRPARTGGATAGRGARTGMVTVAVIAAELGITPLQ